MKIKWNVTSRNRIHFKEDQKFERFFKLKLFKRIRILFERFSFQNKRQSFVLVKMKFLTLQNNWQISKTELLCNQLPIREGSSCWKSFLSISSEISCKETVSARKIDNFFFVIVNSSFRCRLKTPDKTLSFTMFPWLTGRFLFLFPYIHKLRRKVSCLDRDFF